MKSNIKGLSLKILNSKLRYFNLRLAPYASLNHVSKHLHVDRYIRSLYSQVSDIDGCIVELGFGRGLSACSLVSIAHMEKRKIFLFDSFSGFPKPTSQDRSTRNPKEGEWNYRSIDQAKSQLIGFGVPNSYLNSNLTLVKGFVEETLPNFHFSEPIAFLHVDLDLYSAYQTALKYLWEAVAPGGLVLFDEYLDESWPGATLAINEFLELRSLVPLRHDSGKHYVIKPAYPDSQQR